MPDVPQAGYEKGTLYALNIADIQPDPGQPRKYFDEQALAELKASIEKHGVLQPILVRQATDGTAGICWSRVSGAIRLQNWPDYRRSRLFLQMAILPSFPLLKTCCVKT